MAHAALRLRPATPGDAEALASLAGELDYQLTPAEAGERLAALPVSDEVWVAEIEGEVVGFVHLSLVRRLIVAPHLEVLALVVRDAWRGDGVGARLMDLAEHWGIERGAGFVYVRSAVRRERAHHFYLELGYRELKTSRVFVKSFE